MKPPDAPRRGLYLATWGCQMNVYDTRRMADALSPLGFAPVATPAEAELVLLNTCHIREKATEKLFSELGRLRAVKQGAAAEGRALRIGVAGCVAQAEGPEILARAPYVDLVVGPQTYHRLPALLARVEAGERVCDIDFPADSKFDALPEAGAPQGASAFLSVQEGCDKFCAFCVVPFTRGAEASRPVAPILAEARRLLAQGAREIVLLGQNVNAYAGAGPDGASWGLGRLLRAVADLGAARLRYTTSHPLDVDDALLAAHRELPQLMPFLHLPVQSGSDRVLAAMNRRHTRDDYRRVVERLRTARPDLALGSDFIVGFPGETEAQFAETLSLVAEIGFAQAYSFKYSPRPGTAAARLTSQVPEAEKDDRLKRLQAEIEAGQRRFNQASVGATLDVLLERPGRRPGQLQGRSPFMQAVHCDAPARLVGEIVPVRILGAHGNSLSGVVSLDQERAA